MGDVVSLEPEGSAREYKLWSEKSDHLPATLQQGLLRYLENGISPGHFLTAVLTNNLFDAIGRADELSLAALPDICKFLYNYAPSGCWGSKEKMVKYQNSKWKVKANG